ncbi:glycoside hydrolase family 13 protein [Synechocystis salina]|uniref:Glycoside hydrolase family 13 protein n=1 Tax=Synechocystis salina LEGE 00031 TaxID=1828736 RepID=A0ABR9VWK0_9SYNC|nr:glycoside hydrolase family 13 protein [Synechocystis salina]MBE9242563.1 glycoside hydrolase family 13 protein [Synechocystis salina LEGE 00041]MBE9255742.1 glycoside hydrolase family 13 protein [Synechocystis salina LEGE 00031]
MVATPDWVKKAVFYQIFPDRFAIGHHQAIAVAQQPKLEPWETPLTVQGYKGGNLWGVIEQLDYLQELGITALYLTPIFQSACNHRYHTHDYYQVDPLLGGNEALQALLTAVHEREMKVVLDGVFNHASRGFYFFNDILENGPHSPWLDWFYIEDWPLSAYDGSLPANYRGWVDLRALPQFNHDNPDVREYLMRVGEYWIAQGIDGWRLDVPDCVKAEGFWAEFRRRVKAINPEAYIVGEIWCDASPWLGGDQFDGVMNYRFTEPTVAFTIGDRLQKEHLRGEEYRPYPALNADAYGEKISQLLQRHPWEIQLTQLNLLNSHDTARLLTLANGDRPSVNLALLLMFTFPGAPCVYYGDEVGLAGGADPDCRRVFPAKTDWDLDCWEFYRQLIALRHRYQCLQLGDYKILVTAGMGYAFQRQYGDETLIIAVNAGDNVTEISLSPEILDLDKIERIESIFTTDSQIEIQQTPSVLSVTMPPQSGKIFRFGHQE